MKNESSTSAHCFAIYSSQQLINCKIGQAIRLDDGTMQTRITKVLRLNIDDFFVVFDDQLSLTLQLSSSNQSKKGHPCAIIQDIKKHTQLSPEINLYIGILKKDSLERVVYDATALGVKSITPVITSKVHRSNFYEKEYDRLTKIMISAAEQSKQFIIPKINKETHFDKLLDSFKDESSKTKIYFDPEGKQALSKLNELAQTKPYSIDIFCGPEGGLTNEEIKILDKNNFIGLSLTPTILRSIEAVTVGIGMIRSCLKF